MNRTALALVFFLPAALCAGWTVRAGKDLNWDLLNYHYYLPFELLAGRLEQDFFAASAQSYLNPVGYLPFYLMVSSGWHSVVASVVLAAIHSLSLALLYLLAWRSFAHLPRRDRVVLSLLATAIGAATAVFWTTVGTSFLDPLLVPPMLAGLLLLLEDNWPAVRRATLAGALFGAAAALKYSNAIFALAALPLVLAMPGLTAAARLRASLGYAAGGIAALALLAGPWFALMIREFGNPVFPLMNGWFRSPDAPAVNMVSIRFTPPDLIAQLTFPFRLVALDRKLYSENFAPDIRFAALLAAAVALPFAARWRNAPRAGALRGQDWRLLAFFAAGLTLWVASSANARYGLIVLLVAGVVLCRIAERVLPPAAARVTLALVLIVQLGMSVMASPTRWFIAEPWSPRWLSYDVPERALGQPTLYITIEMLPMAVIAPFVHPASSFVNFRGQHSLPADSPRLAALLERHRGAVRTLGRALELVDGKPPAEQVKAYDDTLRRIGYRVDVNDCFSIPWRSEERDLLATAANRVAAAQPAHEPLSVASCALVAAARDPVQEEAARRFSAVFDRMERSCPALFRGQTAVTEPLAGGWSRHYQGLDARLEASADRIVLNRYRADLYFNLGALSDWERADATLPQACQGP